MLNSVSCKDINEFIINEFLKLKLEDGNANYSHLALQSNRFVPHQYTENFISYIYN